MKDIAITTEKEDIVDKRNKRMQKQLPFRYWFGWSGSLGISKKK